MKKLLFLLFILSFYTANAQYDSTRTLLQVNGYGYDYRNGKFRGPVILQGGLPTMARKDSGAISYSGGKLHLFDGNDWQEVGISGGGSSDGIDSFSVVVAAYADTLQFWKADTVFRSYVVKKRNGLIFGCEVTAVNDTTFSIGTANYVVNGLEYNSSAGTILTNSNNDSTGRYLVLGVDDTGFPFGILGSNAANPQIPALTASQVGCATVYFPPLGAAPVINNYTSNVYNVGTDSSAFRVLSVLNDTTAIWCDLAGRCDTLTLRYVGPDGLISGGIVTQLTDSTFGVTSAIFQINSVIYGANGDTLEISPPPTGDSSRIDIIVADTTGNFVLIEGVASETPNAPNIDYLSQIPITFIFVTDDSTTISPPVEAPLWTLVQNTNSLTQIGGFRVSLKNGIILDSIPGAARIFSGRRINLQSNVTSGTGVFVGHVGGNPFPTSNGSLMEVGFGTLGATATTGIKNGLNFSGNFIHTSGSQRLNFINADYSVSRSGGSDIYFISHSPSVFSFGGGNHYFLHSTQGKVYINESGESEFEINGSVLSFKPTFIGTQSLYSGNEKSYLYGSVNSAGNFLIQGEDTTITLRSLYDANNKEITIMPTGISLGNSLPSATNPDYSLSYLNNEVHITPFVNTADSIQVLRDSITVLRGQVDSLKAKNNYKVFRALVSQSGTDAPTMVILQNDLGTTPTWSYIDVGTYELTCTNCFTFEKTFTNQALYISPPSVADLNATLSINYPNSISFSTYEGSGSSNNVFQQTPLEIIVYD